VSENEYVSAVSRFADDLYLLGIARPLRDEAIRLYMSALLDESTKAWRRFYQHVCRVLEWWSGTPFDPDAAWRLSALIEDDFGMQLFDERVRARLRRTLLQESVASIA
jgi:hypothetical protein